MHVIKINKTTNYNNPGETEDKKKKKIPQSNPKPEQHLIKMEDVQDSDFFH